MNLATCVEREERDKDSVRKGMLSSSCWGRTAGLGA